MTSTSNSQVKLPGGIVGFRFYHVMQRIGAEWGVEHHLVSQALWSDFSHGLFDPEGFESTSIPFEITEEELKSRTDLRELVRSIWVIIRPDLDRFPEVAVKVLPLTQGRHGLWAHGYRIGWPEEIDPQGNITVGLEKNIVITTGAILKFCEKRGRSTPDFLAARPRNEPHISEKEAYTALEAIAPKISSKEEHTKDWLAQAVSEYLGKPVTAAMRGFQSALKKAAASGLVTTRGPSKGRPRKKVAGA